MQAVQVEKERLNRYVKDNEACEEKREKYLSLEIKLQEAQTRRNDLENQKEKLEKEKLFLEERMRELTFRWEIVKQNRPGFWKSLRCIVLKKVYSKFRVNLCRNCQNVFLFLGVRL